MKKLIFILLMLPLLLSGQHHMMHILAKYESSEAHDTIYVLTDSTYTVPSGVDSLTIECWGGGGTGSFSYNAGIQYSASGGAGGGYSRSKIAVTEDDELNISVAQRAESSTSFPYIEDGDSSYVEIDGDIVVLATGGLAGATSTGIPSGGTNDNKNDGIGDVLYDGGDGGSGYINGGAGGGGAGSSGDGGDAPPCDGSNTGGSGTSEYGGNGGNKKTSSGSGNIGQNFGGGGGGGRSTTAAIRRGGYGGQGLVRISY